MLNAEMAHFLKSDYSEGSMERVDEEQRRRSSLMEKGILFVYQYM